MDRYSTDLQDMRSKMGVKVIKTPREILQAQLKAWDVVVQRKAAENPLFARILESQKRWAQRVVGWSELTTVPNDLAYEHYFGKSA